ncbi:hypothetical protein [Brytella acorum]|uniref:Uncharacterized protein n=1 Tax=Brytella acorum TaxID=2959299 RepID=A0AA35UEH2_9PROT|nr:hypothetical protein [Brytella acorum]CAI9119563.1 hypothetical protein LMG32879_000380 [Brytella acorum]
MTPEPKAVIAKWLARLARVVRHHQQLSDFDRGEMIADYTAMLLRDDLPCAAFSTEARRLPNVPACAITLKCCSRSCRTPTKPHARSKKTTESARRKCEDIGSVWGCPFTLKNNASTCRQSVPV